jgi:hypothetical protein
MRASGLSLLCKHSGAEERNAFVKLQQRLLPKAHTCSSAMTRTYPMN